MQRCSTGRGGLQFRATPSVVEGRTSVQGPGESGCGRGQEESGTDPESIRVALCLRWPVAGGGGVQEGWGVPAQWVVSWEVESG